MNYKLVFGKPEPYDYDTILDQLSGTKTHTIRTSSVPLTQFWKNTEIRLSYLFKCLNLKCDNPVLCFEYPVKPEIGKGKSSMTDLMILNNNFKIAIEAKFTEYVKTNPVLISSWRKKGKNTENRENVLKYWTSLMEKFTNVSNRDLINEIDYQFYHRTASACKNTDKAIVIYQLFYDNDTKAKLNDYKKKLTEYVKILNPNENLSFYIWEVEVERKLNYLKNNDPFTAMRYKDVYDIGDNDLTLIQV